MVLTTRLMRLPKWQFTECIICQDIINSQQRLELTALFWIWYATNLYFIWTCLYSVCWIILELTHNAPQMPIFRTSLKHPLASGLGKANEGSATQSPWKCCLSTRSRGKFLNQCQSDSCKHFSWPKLHNHQCIGHCEVVLSFPESPSTNQKPVSRLEMSIA